MNRTFGPSGIRIHEGLKALCIPKPRATHGVLVDPFCNLSGSYRVILIDEHEESIELFDRHRLGYADQHRKREWP